MRKLTWTTEEKQEYLANNLNIITVIRPFMSLVLKGVTIPN